ncbi:thiosulfate ABC transporter substrate-binding protein CysP [Kaistia dalseonensis]|uniref:Sulfate transport system substrate-binding protein n=1 Tax=Kaistia dalseonensis TaxID=410840 RepID=A0ABU0H1P4_9HYPH|nr:thiosulfate ABC transporter substrate-binding protein CysP [Kaistia dalseonensis]MCX5493399.1 thiosulfate ABC transporter substrate-binding protein CysP [Kaistia dalseonensis]MDQ0435957.1 sulfate transport system substrate-binding protein [Kaistia dalseonensis]
MRSISILTAAAVFALGGFATASAEEPTKILNASYDVSRELFVAVDKAFVEKYAKDTGKTVTIDQSHAGSSKQARSILEGLDADVVTFNQTTDVQVLADKGFVAADWQAKFPNHASPYYSLPVFLVRAGNPKNIKDWDDLVRDDVKLVFPNPKTSGNARYTYLAAMAYAKEKFGNDDAKVEAFMKKFLSNVPVFDTGGRAATTTFVEREVGDVLITFETETMGIRKEFGDDKFQTVTPSVSLLADFPVAVVDKVADKRGSRQLATDYLNFLYTPEGQTILAENGNRVRNEAVAAKFADSFPKVRLVTVDEVFGSWADVTKKQFGSDGVLDRLLAGT